jgi:hypothetical protein
VEQNWGQIFTIYIRPFNLVERLTDLYESSTPGRCIRSPAGVVSGGTSSGQAGSN